MVWAWVLFLMFVFVLLALDLGVFHREAHVVSIREALGWSAVWISLSLAFSILIYFGYENRWLEMGATLDAVDKRYNDGTTAAVKPRGPPKTCIFPAPVTTSSPTSLRRRRSQPRISRLPAWEGRPARAHGRRRLIPLAEVGP